MTEVHMLCLRNEQAPEMQIADMLLTRIMHAVWEGRYIISIVHSSLTHYLDSDKDSLAIYTTTLYIALSITEVNS